MQPPNAMDPGVIFLVIIGLIIVFLNGFKFTLVTRHEPSNNRDRQMEDKMQQLDLQIKTLQLEKLKQEVEKLKQEVEAGKRS
ncbi:unnamed protein product [Sympodiomycopsis kandeliae]